MTTVKITDFGIASRLPRVHREATSPDRLEGTLAYLSPEQTGRMNRAVDHRSDLYALGATFYEMLTGRVPFVASDAMELVHSHLAVRPDPPHLVQPAVPEALSEIVVKLLAKAPEDRYQSAYGLVRDLEQSRRQWSERGQIEPFPLGQHDVASRFQIPSRLYGREAEIAAMTESFERVSAGATELLVLAGSSGVGKSVLVGEIQRAVTERRGHLVSGKFDQFSSHSPYASLIDALSELVRQLLGEPPEQLARWRDTIVDNLGGNLGVVADVIPDVTRITGPPPPVPDLGPTEAQHRFNLVFRQFIGTFTSPDHPLVLFLDDLHWGDAASIRLLRTLVTDPDAHNLLIIGAFRPEEVEPDGPLLQALESLDPARVRRLDLGPLSLEVVVDLVADALRTTREEATSLGALVHERTAGNPFFVGQFLLSLTEDGLIRFAADTGRWLWDLPAIRERGMTDNVVDLMAGRISDLPPDTQEALRVAAVIGNTFDLGTLAATLPRSLAEAAVALDGAARAGLLLPLGEAHELLLEGLEVGNPDDHHLSLPPRSRPAGLLLAPRPRRRRRHPHPRRATTARPAPSRCQRSGSVRRRRPPQRRSRRPDRRRPPPRAGRAELGSGPQGQDLERLRGDGRVRRGRPSPASCRCLGEPLRPHIRAAPTPGSGPHRPGPRRRGRRGVRRPARRSSNDGGPGGLL